MRCAAELCRSRSVMSPAAQHLDFKGQGMVIAVFEAMQAYPARLLPRDELAKFEVAHEHVRLICDYVAAMTDARLLKPTNGVFLRGWVRCSTASELIPLGHG